MKYLILFLAFAFSCNNNGQKSASTTDNKSSAIRLDVVGTWKLLYFPSVNPSECPIITFFDDGSGRLVTPSREESPFSWKCGISRMTLSYKANSIMRLFFRGESEFYYVLIEKENSVKLQLISVNRDGDWLLSKTRT